jgi:hypothetical protein
VNPTTWPDCAEAESANIGAAMDEIAINVAASAAIPSILLIFIFLFTPIHIALSGWREPLIYSRRVEQEFPADLIILALEQR